MHVTLVALFGRKPAVVAEFIHKAQELLHKDLGDAFTPYELEQVHATIIGLEGQRLSGGAVVNTNYLTFQRTPAPMDLDRAIAIVRGSKPIRIRVGGFREGAAYPFKSRTEHPFNRSFVIDTGKQTAHAMGWPVESDTYPASLDRLRRSLNEANIFHKYHRRSEDTDNDFFFVLGRVQPERATRNALEHVTRSLRERMASTELHIDIDPACLSIVGYDDPALPPGSSIRIPLARAQARDVAALYTTLYTTSAASGSNVVR